MPDEPVRSQAARAAAELALVRIVRHFGSRPKFVVIGGLVPQLLCSAAGLRHAGTTDIDVQVDVAIASGSVDTARLERALQGAQFQADDERAWRWSTAMDGQHAVVKFELLADLADQPSGAIIHFDDFDFLPRLKSWDSRSVHIAERLTLH